MKVRVQFTGQLRAAAERSEEEIELPDASSLSALLRKLAAGHTAIAPHLVTDSGQVQPSLLVVMDDAVVSIPSASMRILREGDVVTLLPPIAGG